MPDFKDWRPLALGRTVQISLFGRAMTLPFKHDSNVELPMA